jgi:hypothetical protein
MRKLVLLIVAVAISSSLFSQMQISNLSFVFESKSEFTEQFLAKEDSKQFNLQIEGITNLTDAQALEHMVKEMRGVEMFKMEPSGEENQYIGKLKVYKHASGWWYWKTFMEKVGVSNFRIENQVYTAEQIKDIN